MASIREQILLAIVARLGIAGTPATGGVFRSQLDQLEQAQLPCFDVSPGDEKVQEEDRVSVTRTLPVTVRAIVDAAAQSGNAAVIDDSVLDPFYVFAVQQIAGGDFKLGGLANEVEELGARPVFQPGGKAVIGLEIDFEVIFATQRGNPAGRG